MMFRNVHEEEESESDWDDLTPHISPHHQPRPPPLHSPSPQHLSPPPSSTSSHTLIQPEKSLSALPTGASQLDIRKENGIDEAEFDSLSARQNSATPPPLQSSIPQLLPHSKYTLTTSPASPVISPPLSTTHLPITQGDPPSHPTPPLAVAGRRDESPIDVQADDAVVPHKHGMFEFGMIVDSRQLHVEREKQMHATVMAGLADRSEKMLRRVFQEFFSSLRLCTDIVIVFILECVHCIAFHVLRKLLCGLLFTCLSSLSAPGLTDCYNVVVWPLALCCLQVIFYSLK